MGGNLRRLHKEELHDLYPSSNILAIKLEFSRQILEKSSNIKFRERLSSGSRVASSGQTDGRDEANCGFSQF